MVVHRHDLRPTLARLCRLLTKSPALDTPKAAPLVPAAEPIVAPPDVAPAVQHT
jgi:acetyl-CoA carboxylase carboxyl transferase subunit beta